MGRVGSAGVIRTADHGCGPRSAKSSEKDASDGDSELIRDGSELPMRAVLPPSLATLTESCAGAERTCWCGGAIPCAATGMCTGAPGTGCGAATIVRVGGSGPTRSVGLPPPEPPLRLGLPLRCMWATEELRSSPLCSGEPRTLLGPIAESPLSRWEPSGESGGGP